MKNSQPATKQDVWAATQKLDKKIDCEIEKLGGRANEEFIAVRREMADGFAAVRKEMADGFAAVDRRFDALEQAIRDGFENVNQQIQAAVAVHAPQLKDHERRIGRLESKFSGTGAA